VIIGLNGRLKAGKDTTYSVIKNYLPHAEQVSFAAPLKESAAAAIGVTVEELELLKGIEEIKFRPHIEDSRDLEGADFNFFIKMKSKAVFNVRQYLQWYGTEAHRDVFGQDFWVDQALPLDLDHHERLLVVTDMRFPNEMERVIALGGVTVKVVRETATAHSNHPSEQNLDAGIQHFLDNTGDLDALHDNTRRLLIEIGAFEPTLRMIL
jgi:hypothetical protein